MVKTLRPSYLVIIFVFCTLFQLSCNNNAETIVSPAASYKVHLVGRVLNKEGNPVPYTIVHLKKYNVNDTTISNGQYEITINLTDTMHPSSITAGQEYDSLEFLKDGQLITTIKVGSLIDTLPELYIVQRNISGTINPSISDIGKIEIGLWNETDQSTIAKEAFYNRPVFSYSGFIYSVYNGVNQNYIVYAHVYDSKSHFVARTNNIPFTSIAGDIVLPEITSLNAYPSVNVTSSAQRVSLNDTLILKGTATDNFNGKIIKWEWSAGTTGKFVETTDSNYVTTAPSDPSITRYFYVLRVTDSDSNVVSDTVWIDVCQDVPTVKITTPKTIYIINDTIHFAGSVRQEFGKIIKWEWDLGNTGIFITTPDSNFVTIATKQAMKYPCVVRVTDEDNNAALGTVALDVYHSGITDIEGNLYHGVQIGTQIWTVENLRTTKFTDGTTIPDITYYCDDSVNNSSSGHVSHDVYTNLRSKFGALYNWSAVDSKKIAPAGWHIPDTMEWNILWNYLVANGYGAKELKSVSYWTAEGGNNATGFNAYPGGYAGSFSRDFYRYGWNGEGYWWTSTISDSAKTTAFSRAMCSGIDTIRIQKMSVSQGLSIRLVKD